MSTSGPTGSEPHQRNGSHTLGLAIALQCDPGDLRNRVLIKQARNRVAGHWVGAPDATVSALEVRCGGLVGAVDAFGDHVDPRLSPLPAGPFSPLGRLITRLRLGDPLSNLDAWRPWKRRRADSLS